MLSRCCLLLLIFVFGAFVSYGQQVTTFILVRHAEKDMTQSTDDPELSAMGKARAERLKSLLKDAGITAVYSTNYKRTKDTVTPVALSKSLEVGTYEPMKTAAIDEIFNGNKGGTILISGHSNTIPWTANYLLGTEQFKNYDDAEYDNVLIITVVGDRTSAKALRLHF